MQTKDAVVLVEKVVKTHQRGRIATTVLRGVDLRIPHGEFFALTGPSGSGKTTLLNLIAGIDRPTSGRIVVDGTDLTTMSEDALGRWRRGHVGFVFQFYNLLPVLTAEENVEMPLHVRACGGPRVVRHHHDRLLELAVQRLHQIENILGALRVEVARRFVGDEDVRISDDRACNGNALLLAP